MKLHQALILLLSQLDPASAWLSSPISRVHQHQPRAPTSTSSSSSSSSSRSRFSPLSAHSPADFLNSQDNNLDAILSEQPPVSANGDAATNQQSNNYRIVLPAVSDNQRATTILASATTAVATTSGETRTVASAATADTTTTAASADTEADPYASAFDSQMEKMQMYAERVEESNKGSAIGDRFKNMDLQDIISTLIIPSIALFAAGRWVYNRVSSRVVENTDAILDAFARELIYHDGDFDEMKLCFQDYSRKLMILGPSKTETMLKTYLESYAKKKTVNPQAIVSLSYIFTLAKLSEGKAANILVSLCRKMGPEKISSAGKILFLGNRILKSPEGLEALEPIKEMIKATYGDIEIAETMVETSQQAMAEASYRVVVQTGGKSQTSLTEGWQTLGLDRDTAQRIFNNEAEEGFALDRETMYGGQKRRYDKKGRLLNKDGKLDDPAEAAAAKNEAKETEAKETEAVSNVYECGECGYTLFIAQGRESKFFGPDFKCPECGAAKDKFEARDDFGEE